MKKTVIIIIFIVLMFTGAAMATYTGLTLDLRMSLGGGDSGGAGGTGDAVLWDGTDAILWDASGDKILWD